MTLAYGPGATITRLNKGLRRRAERTKLGFNIDPVSGYWAKNEVDDEELGNGRLVLLHDPAGNPAWDGTFRCVTFARASVDTAMALDPLLADVGWSWLLDALERHSAAYTAPSGTVTSVSSRSFGSMEDDPERAEVEIRASWTPLVTSGHEMVAHLRAWEDLLCMVAGLPSLPEGVVPMPLNRSARRRR